MIDQSLLTAPDFMAVRASLVAALGGNGNRALVLTRVHWRARPDGSHAIQRGDQWWWRTTYSTIGKETGLSTDQVRRAMEWLIENGYIQAVEHRLDGYADRTLSFRVITSMADSPSRVAESPDSLAESPRQSMAKSPSLLSYKDTETLSAPNAERDEFDEFWSVYPRRVAKGTARTAWARARKKADADTIVTGAKVYARSVAGSEERFIAHPATWLNGERWADKPVAKVTPVDWMNRPAEKAGWQKLRDGEL